MSKRKRSATGGRRQGPGGARDVLLALPSLRDLPVWGDLSPSERQRADFTRMRETLASTGDVKREELFLGCVVCLDRGFPAVLFEGGVVRAEFAAQLTKSGFSRIAVGDWVCLRIVPEHEVAQAVGIVLRENDIARWRGGSRGERQTLAANVDLVLVVQPLGGGDGGAGLARIARSALVAADCHAHIAVVLTKADRLDVEGTVRAVAGVRELLGDGVPMVVTSAADVARECESHGEALRALGASWGLDGVRELVPKGTVSIVLGESGAGKSTVLNRILGYDVLKTGAVRGRDGAGRHTTVARRMVRLPGGGVVVDEPGLRSLPLVGHERGLAALFPEVARAACECRFRDCTHTHEPGCAVRRALFDGTCERARVDAWVALAAEMRTGASSLDPDVVL